MKTQKLFLIAAISCMLLGVSAGAAMAEGCGDGVLQGEYFTGNLKITGDHCTIISSTIAGNLRVINLDNVVLLNNTVGGKIEVDGNAGNGTANVIANTVFGGPIIIKDMEIANVIENETLNTEEGDIFVNSNVSAVVQKNISSRNLFCLENTDVNAFLNAAAQNLSCGN
jgi:hypothetical protein